MKKKEGLRQKDREKKRERKKCCNETRGTTREKERERSVAMKKEGLSGWDQGCNGERRKEEQTTCTRTRKRKH